MVAADQEHRAGCPRQLAVEESHRVAGDMLRLEQVSPDRDRVGVPLQRHVHRGLQRLPQEETAPGSVAAGEGESPEGSVEVEVGQVEDAGHPR